MGYRRRPPGGAAGTETLYAKVSPEAKAYADKAAGACGVSLAEFMDHYLAHLGTTLDEHDVPAWWTLPLPQMGALDISA